MLPYDCVPFPDALNMISLLRSRAMGSLAGQRVEIEFEGIASTLGGERRNRKSKVQVTNLFG